MIQIAIANFSTAFADTDLPNLVAALQVQVSRDFYPVWGVDANITAVPIGQHPPDGVWVLGLFDDADQAGALGYHDITPAGLPLGKIFVKTTLADGGLVSVTASHEALEMLADPDINLLCELDNADGMPSRLYCYEVADACEADEFGYQITPAGGDTPVTVSDFVFPSWFELFRTVGPFDFQGKISQPFQLLPGGYIGYLDLGNLSEGWQQETAQAAMSARAKVAARPHIGSRRYRRALRRSEWVASTYTPGK